MCAIHIFAIPCTYVKHWDSGYSVHTKYIVMRQHDIESFHDPLMECILGNKANTARKWTCSFLMV